MPEADAQLSLDDFDPLADDGALERDLVLDARKREIRNILESYTGSFDFLSEPLQNALDAVDTRRKAAGEGYEGRVWVTIDLKAQVISVTDNGVGFNRDRFQTFLRPNVSYKFRDHPPSRGNKGVGATYLAYGFNSLEVATRTPDFCGSVLLPGGRTWVEDTSGTIDPPKFKVIAPSDPFFAGVDQGSSFVLKLDGPHIRPSDLGWIGARNAEQWAAILRIKSPAGEIHLRGDQPPVEIRVAVIDKEGNRSETSLKSPAYYYPHTIAGFKVARLGDIISAEQEASAAGRPTEKIHARFKKLHGMYETWTFEQILSKSTTIHPELDEAQLDLVREFKIGVYGYFCYSTSLWDAFNDDQLKLRKKQRILRGGLQFASNHMPQGELITIPLTSAIGYQQTTHVVVHLEGAHPDLGRKGFQPEITEVAGKLSTAVVATFKGRRKHLLAAPGGRTLSEDLKKHDWIKDQEKHEEDSPLILDPKLMLHAPLLAIDSLPQSEQDVIALFNELLSAGVLRGYQLLATSAHDTYDGLFRVRFSDETTCIYNGETAPLGLARGVIPTFPWRSEPKIIEYKYTVDGLIDDFDHEAKFPRHIALVVAWELGTAWKRDFEVVSLLEPESQNQRSYYGATHQFLYPNGQTAFEAVILSNVLDYLRDPQAVVARHAIELASK